MDLDCINVSTAKVNQFAKRGIESVEDLLKYLPKAYKDYSTVANDLLCSQDTCFRATVLSSDIRKSKVTFVTAKCREQFTGKTVFVRWFHSEWILERLRYMVGRTVVVAGKVDYNDEYGTYSVLQPDFFDYEEKWISRIYPVYRKIPGMSIEYLIEKISDALDIAGTNSETLPDDLLKRTGLPRMPQALKFVHSPSNMLETELGAKRMLFNELLRFAVHNELNKREVSSGSQYNIKSTALVNKVKNNLPYKLTDDQESALDKLISLGGDGRRIHSLIQGDVGCGKTIVCLLVAAAMIGSGYQVALMAPTQVLAKQHLESAKELLEPYGIRIGFLHGALKKSERAKIAEEIQSGSIQLVIGTHTCISSDIKYKELALTIVDEEHKFGVAQRAKIVEKGAKGVHSITTSATPIPRSLAQVIYGDNIDLLTIRTMPRGRLPVITGIGRDRQKLYRFILKEIRNGHQVYVVCPMIDANEQLEDVMSIEEVSKEYKSVFSGYPDISIASLTGRSKKEDAESVIQDFQNGKYNILIATTVIEVGVNVPNATLIVITSAERFGLSGLHQLRGRVGRSNLQSYCVLQTDVEDGKALERLNTLCRTNDGFEIAEADLKFRGSGDILGTQQSGVNKYISLMLAHPEEYDKAKKFAKELIDLGPDSCKLMQKIMQEREEA